jgi:hypothetical protein
MGVPRQKTAAAATTSAATLTTPITRSHSRKCRMRRVVGYGDLRLEASSGR